MTVENNDDSVVKKGGIGSDAEAGDVTRDTYGFGEGDRPAADESDDATRAEARRQLDEMLPDDE